MKPSDSSLLIKNGTIITSKGETQQDVLIENGIITKLSTFHFPLSTILEGVQQIDATGLFILPGLIDCHVHFREPGLEQKETMATGAAAALAGGVTTVCEMPNTVPPTVTVAALADKIRRADELRVSGFGFRESPKHSGIDIRFFFGATELIHLQTLRELWTGTSEELRRLKKSCCGLKLYLDHSTGDQKAPHGVIDEAFRMCAELGIVVVCHCEDAELNSVAQRGLSGRRDVAVHSQIRPPESEAKAIEYALGLAKKYGTHLHIAHLSTQQGIELVRQAKNSKLATRNSQSRITCEVAPHHLFMTVDDYASLGTLAKMNPPLRTREHQVALWEGIADGTVDCISTDHAPHTLDEKKSGDPLKAPSGVPGVETMVPLLLTVAGGSWPHPSGFGFWVEPVPSRADGGFEKIKKSPATRNPQLATEDIVRLCFENPNRIFNLGKQGIAEGAPADLILVDPEGEWVIRGKELQSKCGWSPYENREVRGKVVRVIQL